MAKPLIRILAAVPGIPMFFIGIGLLIQPEAALSNLSMPMLEGAALSTQLGDMISFFLCSAGFIFMGAYLAAPRWLFAGAALLVMAAVGRLLAWQVYGAALSAEPITIEVVSTIWLIVCGVLLRRS